MRTTFKLGRQDSQYGPRVMTLLAVVLVAFVGLHILSSQFGNKPLSREEQHNKNCVRVVARSGGFCVADVLNEYDEVYEEEWPGTVDLFIRMFERRGLQVGR
jgi:hypothetical protein